MVSQVLSGLLLGDGVDACNTRVREELSESGLIINMTGGKLADTSIPQSVFVIADLGPWSDQDAMFAIFDQAVSIIKEALDQKRKVLVYCTMGMQRSCSIVAAYLMQELDMSLTTAVQYIVANRKIAFDEGQRVHFREALLRWEERIRQNKLIISDL